MQADETHKLEICFRDTQWLHANSLNHRSWLHYFACCEEFYDPKCNNEPLRLQGKPADEIAIAIQEKTGLEFALVHFDPEFTTCVIVKQTRHSKTSTTPQCHYYVVRGSIYCAPSLSAVVQSRLRKCIYHTNQGLDLLRKCHSFAPQSGGVWQIQPPKKAAATHQPTPAHHQVKETAVNKEAVNTAVQQVETMVQQLLFTSTTVPST